MLFIIFDSFLYHQHYSPLGLCESVRIAANHGIHLIGGDGLPILADVQAVAVDHLRYLLGAHPSVLTGKAVEYGFFDFHMNIQQVDIYNKDKYISHYFAYPPKKTKQKKGTSG